MAGRAPRIGLFVLEALPNAHPVRRFVSDHANDIALVGLSNAERPASGGLIGQVRRHLARSGPGILPYLAVNFGLPDLLRPLALLTQRFGGRRHITTATPLLSLCALRGIPTLSIDDVNAEVVTRTLRERAVDLIVTFHFDQILSARTLDAVPLGGINVHPSLLPRHRGPVPTIHAVAEGEGAFGVTVHRLAVTIDAGAILAQEAISLSQDTTATRAAILLHEQGRTVLERVLDTIARDGAIPAGRQVPALPYCGFPSREMLATMRRQNRRLTDGADLREAFALSG